MRLHQLRLRMARRGRHARSAVVIGHALRAWPTPPGVATNSADKSCDEAGELVDTTVQGRLDMLATQLIVGAVRAA